MNPLSPLSPSRRAEAARAALRELVRAARDVAPHLPADEEFLRRRFQSVIARVEALTGADVDADTFDAVFRDLPPAFFETVSTPEERRSAREGRLDPESLSRILADADTSASNAASAASYEARLQETRERSVGVHDALDMFERLRISERRPVVGRDEALDVGLLRRVVASLDANAMKKAADTLIWLAWHHDRAARRASDAALAVREGKDIALQAARNALEVIRKASSVEDARRIAETTLEAMESAIGGSIPVAAE